MLTELLEAYADFCECCKEHGDLNIDNFADFIYYIEEIHLKKV